MYEDKKEGKANTIRLFSLINYYKTNAKEYLTKVKNNPNRDNEFYRQLYKEIALPNLEIEPPSKTELIQLKDRLEKIEDIFNPKPSELTPKEKREIAKGLTYFQNFKKESEERRKFEELHKEELDKKLEENIKTVLAAVKKTNIQKVVLKSSMSPAIRLQI